MDARTNPYVGPRTFTYAERDLFFGREREARELLARVISERLVLFYAQSGAGKSSLINTRLAPQLREAGFAVLPVGRVSGDLPAGVKDVDNIFLFNLMVSLDQGAGDPSRLARLDLSAFLAHLVSEDGERYVYDAAATPPAVNSASVGQESDYTPAPYVLIIDQFEELVTSHPERWEERADFFRQINQAMRDDSLLWVVLTLREDYIAALDSYASLLDDRLRARFYMQRMEAEAALQAIERPAQAFGRPFAPGVAQTLVENLRQVRVHGQTEVRAGQYIEPVQLQVVCYQLWENIQARPEGAITHDDLPQGYVDRALTDFYEDAVRQVVDEKDVYEDQLRDWFDNKLITGDGTRAIIFQGADTGGLPNAAADLLVDLHVLRTETRAGGRWVELVHDRLVNPIAQANAAWRQAHPLIQAALEWREAGKPASKLYQGEQLAAAWNDPDAKVELVHAFLRAGQQAQEEREAAIRAEEEQKRREAEIRAEEQTKRATEQARANRRLRRLVAVLVAVFVVAVVSFFTAMMRRQQAVESAELAATQATVADIARVTAVSAQGTAVANEDLAATKEAEARNAQETAEANKELAVTKAAEAEAQRLEAERQQQIALAQSLAALAPYTNNDDELTTLLAVEALNILGESLGSVRWLIDRALRNVLSKPYFNHTLSGHEDWARSVAFSADGRWLASGSSDRTVRVWNVNDLAAAPRVLSGHESWVLAVAFSPDGRWLASGSYDHTVRVWDMNDLAAAPRVLSGHEDWVWSVAFSPNGRWLASGSSNRTVRVWDMNDLAAAPRVLSGHEGRVWSVAFSPDGRRLASGSSDRTVRVWDMNDLAAAPRVLSGHEGDVESVAFSPECVSLPDATAEGRGCWLVSGSQDGTVWVWDMKDLAAAPRVLSGHEEGVTSVAFSANGRWLASGSSDRTVRVWDMNDLAAAPRVLSGHEGWVASVAFSPECISLPDAPVEGCGRWLVSGSQDGTVRVWDMSDLAAAPRVLSGHEEGVLSVAFSPDGRWLASGSDDRTVQVWDMNDLAAASRVLSGHEDSVESVAFSADGRWLASGSDDRTVRVWDMNDLAAAPRVLGGHEDWIASVAFSADGRWLASGSADRMVRMWDVNDLAVAPRVLSGHESWVLSVAFSPECVSLPDAPAEGCERWLASGSYDHTVRVWDMNDLTAAPRVLSGHKEGVLSVAFSADGRWLASGSLDRTVRVWDMNDLAAPPRVLSGHEDWVWSVAFSPECVSLPDAPAEGCERWLASGSLDHTVRVWAMNDLTAAPRVLSGHEDRVWSVAFSPDGRWLASGSADGTVRMWIVRLEELAEIGCRKVYRNMTHEEWDRYLPGEPYRATCPNRPVPEE